ncbi:GvpL/GvpF family gas vesicle protein [Streptomyces sp. NBC_00878]|uniref:GvpL/GvpF family gas vesicle protein n=1 Tax=Streptomyces sp. NBC_00878 TaxID=2975854 RepID=UPI002254F925|nr:GvpL/GvpF family gas vesicle protein [Streptomyces sp. NBC_00878]MCX4906905.1 GvpL/GvpF family gas vesicle protein [Streptomyces sp. NBC_00878]
MTVYVYAITDAGHPLAVDGARGVGETPAPLRVVRGGSVAAVISDAPGKLRAKRRDLMMHQEVTRSLSESGPVLPMRFGMLAADDEAVRDVLAGHEAEFTGQLRAVEDRVEFNVKVLQDQDTALLEVLSQNDEARRLNALTRAGEGTHEDRVALGEIISAEVEARQSQLGEEIRRALRPLAFRESVGGPSGEAFFSLSLLVERERAQECAAAVRKLADGFGHGVEFRLSGPLPPYSFV